jgi:hypothetical protein
MITPRQDFRNNPLLAKGWQDRVDSAQFQEAVYAALAEMDLQNKAPADMATAASYSWRKSGALQFLSILMNLTATDTRPARATLDNLDHNIK